MALSQPIETGCGTFKAVASFKLKEPYLNVCASKTISPQKQSPMEEQRWTECMYLAMVFGRWENVTSLGQGH